MSARTAVVKLPSNRLAMLAWAPPLLALGLFAMLGIVRHETRIGAAQRPAVAVDAGALAGAGNAILSNATFY